MAGLTIKPLRPLRFDQEINQYVAQSNILTDWKGYPSSDNSKYRYLITDVRALLRSNIGTNPELAFLRRQAKKPGSWSFLISFLKLDSCCLHILYQNFLFLFSRSELQCRVKYNNTLPDLPFDPKFISCPFGNSRFTNYVSTTLEQQMKYEFITEQDLGVHVDLILPDAYAQP